MSDNHADPNNPDAPFSSGMVSGTESELHCGFCDTIYNEGIGVQGSGRENEEGESVRYIDFGPITIAGCCFRKFELAMRPWAPEFIDCLEDSASAHRAEAKRIEDMARRGRLAIKDAFDDNDDVPF